LKKSYIIFILLIIAGVLAYSLTRTNNIIMNKEDNFKYQTEQFADLAILRYQVPGWDKLTPSQKELAYYLYEAALSGRDIFYDQNYRYNLTIRRTLEAVVNSYKGDRESKDFKNFMVYTKRFWFSNGIHHHYSTRKFMPEFSEEYFTAIVLGSDISLLPLEENEKPQDLLNVLIPVMFDPEVDTVRVNLDPDVDIVKASANNYYAENLTQAEVEKFYESVENKNDPRPIWYGLNSKLVKDNGKVEERVWKIGGMYSPAIERIVYWLEKASGAAENDLQKKWLDKLIGYYKTGDLRKYDEYSIFWVQDTVSTIDALNSFIEVYGDPLGHKGAYEAMVSIKDFDATTRIEAISNEAQWFEDNSPILPEHKKKNVVGISAKVITVVVESGDASPATPIGINLPNANWIRQEHGSKSVNLGNIVYAYDKASSEAVLREFYYDDDEIRIVKEYGTLADNLHTDLHEVIGHASGQINPGVGTPKQTLKSYASTIEETRADLVALYYLPDNKMMEIGVVPHQELYKAEFLKFILNGLMLQLQRIKPGENIEESHMRNRQIVAHWAYELGMKEKVIERKLREGKTYFVINDYVKLRRLFGEMLRDVQRITSEGDYESARKLVEKYGVKVDPVLHKEVLTRYEKLNIAPYKGFINPRLRPVMNNGKITDVIVEYPEDFTEQMLYYSENYSFLPNKN
jgi:dipeptidyl-peptidase III